MEEQRPVEQQKDNKRWVIFLVFFLIITVLLVGAYLFSASETAAPSPTNPPALMPAIQGVEDQDVFTDPLETAEPTPVATASPSPVATATPAPTATATPAPTVNPGFINPTSTPTPTPTAPSGFTN